MKITIVSSSTRLNRISHRIALALKIEIEKTTHDVHIIDLKDLALPTFEERYGHVSDPEGKLEKTFKLLDSSDGLIFLTPEYNGAISSGLKNFIDVFAKKPFEGKPIGVATGSTGALGGIRAAYQLQQTILSIFGYPIPQMLTVGHMDKVIDENGKVMEDTFQVRLEFFLKSYLTFAEKIIKPSPQKE